MKLIASYRNGMSLICNGMPWSLFISVIFFSHVTYLILPLIVPKKSTLRFSFYWFFVAFFFENYFFPNTVMLSFPLVQGYVFWDWLSMYAFGFFFFKKFWQTLLLNKKKNYKTFFEKHAITVVILTIAWLVIQQILCVHYCQKNLS